MISANLNRQSTAPAGNTMELWSWHEAVQYGAAGGDVMEQEWTIVYEGIQRAL